jgi:hypothetical protein
MFVTHGALYLSIEGEVLSVVSVRAGQTTVVRCDATAQQCR